MDTVAPIAEIVGELQKAGGSAFKTCFQCGKCDVVCPWNRVRTFSIRKIIRQATFGLPDIEQDDVWRCTTCGSCPAQCPRGVEQIAVGVSIRRVAVQYDVLPTSARGVRSAALSLADEGNPLGNNRGDRRAWAEGLGVKPFEEGMEILYFVGCYGSYDSRMRKVSVATAKILQRAGVSFGILGDKESCCGESIRKTGNEEVFKSLARQNIKTFIDHGVRRILVSSPHCYHAFAREYREFMVHFEVIHISQYLAELVAQGRLVLSAQQGKRVTWHDPCYLGRHNGIYDQPRDLLKAIPGIDLVEMADNRKNSLCCGGGGGRIWMETPKEERFADLRLQQAKDAGATVLATSCPYCISNFEEAALSLPEGDPLVIRDLTEILLESLEGEATP